nr:hypothetical protein [Tanacetum cinerariifolium]
MDSGSSCKVIYEHCFLKLKPSIQASKVDSQVLLVGFLREKSWAIGEVLLEISIGDAPLLRSETLNFVILRSNSPYNMLIGRIAMQKIGMLLGRIAMQKIGMVVSMIHGAVKFHTTQGIKTVFSTYESNKIEEGIKNIKETSPSNTKGVLSYTDAEEKIIVNSKRMSLPLSKDALRFKKHRSNVSKTSRQGFNDQIGRNVKAYVNDMVIKSTLEEDMLTDTKETFQSFRSINMKLNSKKFSFGVEEGPF